MNSYELVFILKEDKENITNKLKNAIETFGGIIQNSAKWGKKDFSYPIKKLHAGYYFLWTFSLPIAKMTELKKKLAMDEEIVRYLLLKLNSEHEILNSKQSQNSKL